MTAKLPRSSGTVRTITPLSAALLSIMGTAATAQDSTNAPTEMKPTVVTGSYIPTAETVGAAPVDTLTAAQIEKTGAQDILTALKILSPAFSGAANIGQTLNNGGNGESYVAIRNLPTLVLVDGKRLTITPFSNTAGNNGYYSVDLNTFPVAMIERIEVLKDGASAIYGSDAIGGVINIITKKEFNGVEIDGHYGFGLDHGTYNEVRASVVAGYSKDGTKIVAGGQYYYSDPIYTKDRSIGGLSGAELNAAGLHAPSYFSPSYPGRVDSFILAGSPFAVGAPGYIAGLNAPPVFPGHSFNSVADYNTYALTDPTWSAAHPGMTPYIPLNTTVNYPALGTSQLNTTELNTVTVQRQDRRNAFANVSQEIFGPRLIAYGQLLYSENESLGQLAPAPIPFLGPYNLFVPANSPYNPFQIDLGYNPDTMTAGASSPRVRSRLIETGNRKFDSFSSNWLFKGGVMGTIEEKYHYDINASYNQVTQREVENSASAVLLNQAMTPGVGGNSLLGVPIYNIFSLPGFNNPNTVNAVEASDKQGGFADLLDVQGVFRADLFDLPAGKFQLAAGGQWVAESLETFAGSLLASGNLIGLTAISPFTGGNRNRYAGFIEAQIPVVSPDKQIPGLHSFDITAAGRYEIIESGSTSHDSLVPKVGFRWQPFDDEVTIRGTYSQGFVVPPLNQLFGPPIQSTPYVVSPDDSNNNVPTAVQQTVNYQPNPDLPPSTAETFTLGVVVTPKFVKGLTVSADYYHITQPSVAFYPSPSLVVADLNANGINSVYFNNPALHGAPIYIDENNNPYGPGTGTITVNNFNQLNDPLLPNGAERTQGIDFGLDYRIETKKAGTFDLFANANVTLSYEVSLGGGPYYNYKGQYTDIFVVGAGQGTIPNFNITCGLSWYFHNFDYTVIAHFLPAVTDYGDLHPSAGATNNDFTVNGQPFRVPDYYKIDMQLAYNFKSDTGKKWYDGIRAAIGLNNITDNKPPLVASSQEDNTDKSTYDIIGRFLYVELSKKF